MIAKLVWDRLGDVPNLVEPFFGSGAVLLARPHQPKIETVNDLNGFIANFWRAIQCKPDEVAKWADWPVNENDLHARHIWLVERKYSMQAWLEGDPDWHDAKIAGWWVWGMACWIGSGFCSGDGPWQSMEVDGVRQLVHLDNGGRGINRQRIHLGDAGRGINRQLVHLGNAGRGINRKRPHLGNAGLGINRPKQSLIEYFNALADRLRNVRVCCGDWTRVCGPTPTYNLGLTGVFLDPPYGVPDRDSDLYVKDDIQVAHAVREWAIEQGKNPLMRIVLCGYDEHDMPVDWQCIPWKTQGGYSNQNTKKENQNKERERIWFSPHCINPVHELSLDFGKEKQ